MNGIAILILALIGGGVGASSQGPGDWIKYNSPKGRYSILVPGEPSLSTKELNSNGKRITQYRAMASEANFGVFVAYYDYASTMEYSLNQAREVIIGSRGTLLSEGKISFGGARGIEMNISSKGPDGVEYLLRVKLYDIDRRVYVVQFIIPRSEDNNESAEKAARFFNSFRVMKR